MTFTNEMLVKAKTAASPAELQTIAKEFNIELTENEADKYFNYLKDNVDAESDNMKELSPADLEMVSGGKGEVPSPKYAVGQHLWLYFSTTMNYAEIIVDKQEFYDKKNGWRYIVTDPTRVWFQNYYLETSEASRVRTTKP